MLRKLLVTLLILSCFTVSAQAANRYASTSGSGSTCSIGSPCTLTTAISGMAANDTIYARTGTYAAPTIHMVTGTGGNYSTFSNYNGETVTITGGWKPFYDSANSYNKILGTGNRALTITGSGTANETFIIDNGSHHIWIENTVITGAIGVAGVYAGNTGCVSPCGFNTVKNNHIHTNGFNGTDYQYHHGIYISSPDNLVEYNKINNNSCYGVQLYDGAGDVHRNIIRFNEVYANAVNAANGGHPTLFGTCGGITVGSGTSNLVLSNYVRDNILNSDGILVNTGCIDCLVYNNTVTGNTGAVAGIAVAAGATRATVKNNALSLNGTNYNNVGSGTVIDTNACTTSGGTTGCSISASSLGINSDGTLQSGSILINAGATSIGSLPPPLSGSVTAPGNGLAPDIGAKETFAFSSATTVNTSNLDVNLEAARAPFTPTSGVTGWSMTVDTGAGPVAKTVTAVTDISPSVRRVSCSACMQAGAAIKVSLAANTLRDTSAPSQGQPNFAISNFTVTNTLAGAMATVAVDKIRIRKWSASVAGATEDDWLSTVNQANMTIRNDGAMLAVAWQITANGGIPPTVGFLTDFCAVNTAPCTPSTEVSDSDAVNSVRYDNTNTSQIHGAPISATRLSNPEPTFVSGGVVASTQGYPQPPLVDNSATEVQGMYYIKPGLPNGRVVCIRPKAASGYTLIHNQTACVIIGHPVASSQ